MASLLRVFYILSYGRIFVKMEINEPISSGITKIQKVNLSQATFEKLLDKIMDGTWKQGEKIPSENELKDLLGVSRHTVRSAINNLNMLGLLETRQGDGNYVKATGVALYIDVLIPHIFVANTDVVKIMEFRESIESTAARYAASRATEDEIKQIEKKMILCEEKSFDLDNYLTFDFDFHLAIAEASKSDLIIQSMYVIKKYCFSATSEYFDQELTLDGTRRYHRAIYNAIVSRDPDLACEIMGNHVRSIIKKIKERYNMG